MISRLAIQFKYRYGRGRSWLDYFNPIILIFGIVKYKEILQSPEYLIPIGVFYIGFCYVIGYYDEKYGIWKKEIEYGAHEINLFNQEVMKKLDRILENGK